MLPGTGSGLQLVLNVEQYEYMANRQEVAGAFALVQDQSQKDDLVRGKGFFIGIGQCTAVSIHKCQVGNNVLS